MFIRRRGARGQVFGAAATIWDNILLDFKYLAASRHARLRRVLLGLPLLGLNDFEEESFVLLEFFKLLLCIVVHQFQLVLLSMGSDLGGGPRLDHELHLLPVVSVFVKRYKV